MWTVSDNNLLLENGQSVVFDFPIRECELIDDVFVVLLRLPAGVQMTENVFGVSREGRVDWQIERIPATGTDPKNRYTGIVTKLPARVRIGNWNGAVVEVDIHTGNVVGMYFAR